jgi:hypothetical protein
MGRLLVLLLIAGALIVPTAARSSARTDAGVEPVASAVVGQLAAPSNAKRMAMMCRGCRTGTCGAYAVACNAYCAATNALVPVTSILATITPRVTGPSVISALRDHHGPPDHHPPRPIAIG